jgi:phosphoribosylaminoimidazole-succinocarboxamide synthase
MDVVKGDTIASGKTKDLLAVVDQPSLTVIRNKPDITAFDDPSFTKQFEAKARFATTTTCRVFELLQRSGIPVAYERQFSETEFLARRLQMIALEVVDRRYAVGSYLSRHPELARPKGETPFKFHPVLGEAFLKTTGGKVTTLSGGVIDFELDAKKGEEDPFIINPLDSVWKLFHPKKVGTDPEADLKKSIVASGVLKHSRHMQMILTIAAGAFVVLEGAFDHLGYKLIDWKIEFGYNANGDPVIGDVIDNDSWRLRTKDWEELSKQAFRDGEDLSEVERKYGVVADLVSRPEFLNWR